LHPVRAPVLNIVSPDITETGATITEVITAAIMTADERKNERLTRKVIRMAIRTANEPPATAAGEIAVATTAEATDTVAERISVATRKAIERGLIATGEAAVYSITDAGPSNGRQSY